MFPGAVGIEKGINSALGERIVERIKVGKPDVDIIGDYKKGDKRLASLPQKTPKKNIPHDKWLVNKQSLVLREKKFNDNDLRFLHVFLSVEKAKEGYKFAISPENECPYFCKFCYLQATLKGSPIPTIFTNFQDDGILIREVKIALLGMHMYTQVNGVQSNITRKGKKHVHKLIKVLVKSIPEAKLDQPIQNIFLKYRSDIKQNLIDSKQYVLKPIIEYYEKFDFKNLTRKFHFNNGDVNDGMAFDHLTDNSKFLVNIFNHDTIKNDGGQLLFRTKASNIENLKKVNPNGNVIYGITVGTAFYSKGVPNYKKRIESASELLKLGYKIRINLDPVIQYPDTFSQYKPILDEIRDTMDTTDPNFERITIGMLRFGDTNIEEIIKTRHPDLFKHYVDNMDSKKQGDEEKFRYIRKFRIDTYKKLKNYAEEIIPGVEVKLSTEALSIWDDVGIEWK